MSTLAPHVVPIFATPFAVVTLPAAERLNAALAALFSERAVPERRAAGGPAAPFSFVSRDDLMQWPEEPVQRTLGEMMQAVSSFAASINELGAEQFAALRIQARAWFSLVRTNGCLPSTSHSNSAWLAVYCVTAPEISQERFDSGVLRMHESRLGTMFADPTYDNCRIPYRPGHYTWRPVPGQVAVFPASITHEIALVRASGVLTLVSMCVRFLTPHQAGTAAP